jgi:predicted PurR-regulated permease PerM
MKRFPRHRRLRVEESSFDWARAGRQAWTLIAWLILLAFALWLFGRLWTVMLPLLAGLIIAFLLRPIVEWLANKHVPRVLAVSLAYIGAALVLALIVVLVIPPLVQQAEEFGRQLPEYTASAVRLAEDVQRRYGRLALPEWLLQTIERTSARTIDELRGSLGSIASAAFTTGRTVLGVMTGLLVGVVIGFYLLNSLPRIGPAILRGSPPPWRDTMREVAQRLEEVVGGFIRGQLLVATAVGVLTWLGMAIIGMPLALLLGAIAGVTAVIPFLGPIVAGVLAAIVGLLVSPTMSLLAIAVIVIVQQVESTILSPKIMGSQVGLHPAVVILAIIGGTTLFGFVGLILAVPVVGAAQAVYGYFIEQRGWNTA